MFTRYWHYGLYRRIALGFMYAIALVLTVQVVGFVWLFRLMNSGTSDDVHQRGLAWTRAISSDLARGIEASPSLDVEQRLDQLDVTKRVFAVFRDGRAFGPAPASAVRVVQSVFTTVSKGPDLPEANDAVVRSYAESWENGPFCAAVLMVNGRIHGVVGIVPRTTLERFGPLIGAAGITVLVLAIILFSVVVVRPVRSRLQDLQAAVRRLGKGDLDARARIDGSDEVSEVAQAFNSMAADLQRRTTALETSDRLRRQLVADVSHELMTPLTAVLGHLETLDMDEVQLDEAGRRRQVAIAMREARRLRRVIGDLLDMARYEAHGVQLNIEEISTGALFRQISMRHEHDCRVRDVKFETTVAADAQTFEADPFRIEQALENVVANAFRHTPQGGRITLSACKEHDAIVFEVCDSGEGIPSEHLPHVFDRFYKASSARGLASPGSGLGLSIVKAIVSSHDGRVSATSASGVGTIFKIELPATKQMMEQPAHT